MAYQATPLPVASHKGASLSPGCSTSNPAACRWPEKAANDGLSLGLLDQSLGPFWRVNQQIVDLAVSLSLSPFYVCNSAFKVKIGKS